ncbi:hypothetical protein [Roseibium litorale]|uniref:Flagellar protein FlaG n=1 Tax=Roseibium litorale TaxID=2803841 RepID=A0ABR9CI99_9HYPH|nr:hypothetical protein [Roseibium litorale]MBD8890424.1 hypothetical protein [Roseibium litorale]
METALLRSPSPSYTAITPAARAPERIEPAAKTDLPASRAVTPANDTTESRRSAESERSELPFAQAKLDKQNVLDPESESYIYIATNSDTGEVVRQVPSETLRRLRAYAKVLSEQSTAPQPQSTVKTA